MSSGQGQTRFIRTAKLHQNTYLKKSSHNIFLNTFLSFLMGCLFYSCAKQDSDNRDHLVFRYNEHANITSLDPAFSKDQRNIWACHQLFNSLVELDDQLNVKPDIAKSWTVSQDALTYSFTLRDDVFFHTDERFGDDATRHVIAEDVVYSLKRLTNDNIASPGRFVMQNVATMTAENDSTVIFKLKTPFPAFLGLLSTKYCSILPQEIVEADPDFRSNPIGTGPFKFKRWEENEKLVFRRNERFFQKDLEGNQLPYLEAVAITFLPDKQSEFLQFAQGNIDFLNALDPSYKDELLTANGTLRDSYAKTIKMITGPYLNTEYLGFYLDSETPEISNLKLRQAVNYGFDRKAMITYLRNGIGTPAENGFIPKGLPGFAETTIYDYNPQKAKQLIEAYTTETGDTSPEISISTNANYLDLVEYIQRELGKIGIIANVDVMPPSTIRQQRSAGKLDVFRASWIADYPDAENYLSLFYSKNHSPNGPNYTHYKSDVYDALFEKALVTSNVEERQNMYRTLDSMAMSQAPLVPLYYDQIVRFTQKNISGLGINALNLLDLRTVKKQGNDNI